MLAAIRRASSRVSGLAAARIIKIDIGKLLTVGRLHDEGPTLNVSANVFDRPRRWEAAISHNAVF